MVDAPRAGSSCWCQDKTSEGEKRALQRENSRLVARWTPTKLSGVAELMACDERISITGHGIKESFSEGTVKVAAVAKNVGFPKDARLILEFTQDFGSAIRRPVIDNQNLTLRSGIVLSKHTLDGGFDEALVVVGVDQNAYKWCRHAVSNSRLAEAVQLKKSASPYKI